MADTHCSFQINFLQLAIRNFENALFLHEALWSLSGYFMFGFYPHKRWLYFVLYNGQSLQQRDCIDSFYALFIATFLVFFILKVSSGHFTGSSFMCFLHVGIFKRMILSPLHSLPWWPIHSHKLPISNRKILKSFLRPKVRCCTCLPPSPSSLSELFIRSYQPDLPPISSICHHLPIIHSHLSSSPGLCLSVCPLTFSATAFI